MVRALTLSLNTLPMISREKREKTYPFAAIRNGSAVFILVGLTIEPLILHIEHVEYEINNLW